MSVELAVARLRQRLVFHQFDLVLVSMFSSPVMWLVRPTGGHRRPWVCSMVFSRTSSRIFSWRSNIGFIDEWQQFDFYVLEH